MKILVLEPYYDGSHRLFLDGLQKHLPHEFDLMTLPARKWKWRMRLAAPYFARKLNNAVPGRYNRILCSSYMDVAAFRSLVRADFQQIPINTYFHENQFAYPVQQEDERDVHFGLTNLTTFLASDRVAFNSRYNFTTFADGVNKLLKICPDMNFDYLADRLKSREVVLPPGIDFRDFPEPDAREKRAGNPPIIVWNHRWEYDKDPEFFFRTLFELDEQNVNFRLIVMGQSFRSKPKIFSEAKQKLGHRIEHFGYLKSRVEYLKQLSRADIVVSTARHEFFGISVIEAVRAGCRPLLPKRLSYPEMFPAEFLYNDAELFDRLKMLLQDRSRLECPETAALSERFSWQALKEKYLEWLV